MGVTSMHPSLLRLCQALTRVCLCLLYLYAWQSA